MQDKPRVYEIVTITTQRNDIVIGSVINLIKRSNFSRNNIDMVPDRACFPKMAHRICITHNTTEQVDYVFRWMSRHVQWFVFATGNIMQKG